MSHVHVHSCGHRLYVGVGTQYWEGTAAGNMGLPAWATPILTSSKGTSCPVGMVSGQR